MCASFGRSSGSRVTSQRIARWARGWEKPGERLVEPRDGGADRAAGGRARAGPGGNAVPSIRLTSWTAWSTPSDRRPRRSAGRRPCVAGGRSEASGRPGARAPSRAPASRRRRPGRRGSDLEDERAAVRVDPEVAVALAVERRRLAVDAEHRRGDRRRASAARDLGRARFEDVVAHGAPR